jgi:Sortase domain
VWAGLAGALAVLGATLMVTGAVAQQHAPAPPRDLGTVPAPGSLTPATTLSGHPERGQADAASSTPVLPWSVPVSLAIPAIGVRTKVIKLGLAANDTLQVPPVTPAGVQETGWFDLGPTPGQVGPAVVVGHVDSYQGPGALFRLGALRPGDQIYVTRTDHTVAIFRVDAVDEYSKLSFPTQQVYGAISYAGLRVITCGGSFDAQTHHYLSNIVVYATLTGSRASRNR